MSTNNQQNRQIEYVIGIDLGHGETSAASCPVQWDVPVEQLDPVKDMEMGSNKKVLPSAITILDNGTAYIGDAAFAPEILKQAHVHVCFKKAPKDINGEDEQLMIRFMKEVYKRIRQCNPAMLTDSNHLVYIATPSGWDKATQNLYVEMARMAGLPIGGVTKESRAAFVRAQSDVSSGIGRNIDRGAIVFDMGSSTLDFTYMSKDIPNLIDNGYDCGASYIEKAILSDKAETEEAIQTFKTKYPDLYDYLVFESRMVKEKVYFDPSLRVKKTINFDDFIENDDELEDERFKLSFMPGELDELLVQKGYVDKVREAMKDYRSRFIPGREIHGVFMTGGASRMEFLKDLICECWGVDKSKIYRDQDPSLTISQGVAEVARMDLRTQGMDTGLDDEIQKLQNSDIIYRTFVENYGEHMFESVRDGVADCLIEFRDSSVDRSLNNLQQNISTKVRQVISAESGLTSAYMNEAVAICTAPVREKVENIVRNYASQGFEINMDDINVAAPTVESINLDSIMQEISNKIYEQSANWGELIGGAAIGGVIGFLFPVLGIVGGLAILANELFNPKSEAEKQREAMSRSLSMTDRKKVFESLEQNWDQMQTDMRNSVFNALTSDQRIVGSINETVKELLLAYKENLKAARRLID